MRTLRFIFGLSVQIIKWVKWNLRIFKSRITLFFRLAVTVVVSSEVRVAQQWAVAIPNPANPDPSPGCSVGCVALVGQVVLLTVDIEGDG